jgi:hypothetical protein
MTEQNIILNIDILLRCFQKDSNTFSDKCFLKLNTSDVRIENLLKFNRSLSGCKYVIFKTRQQFNDYAESLKKSIEQNLNQHLPPARRSQDEENSGENVEIIDLFDECRSEVKEMADLKDLNLKSKSQISISSLTSRLSCASTASLPTVKKMNKVIVACVRHDIKRFHMAHYQDLLCFFAFEDEVVDFLEELNSKSSSDSGDLFRKTVDFMDSFGRDYPVCDIDLYTLRVFAVEVGSYVVSDKEDLKKYGIQFFTDRARTVQNTNVESTSSLCLCSFISHICNNFI